MNVGTLLNYLKSYVLLYFDFCSATILSEAFELIHYLNFFNKSPNLMKPPNVYFCKHKSYKLHIVKPKISNS